MLLCYNIDTVKERTKQKIERKIKMTNYEKVAKELGRLTDAQFENFLLNYDDNEKEIFRNIRFWEKMKTGKEFYNKVEQALAKETYKYFNN